MKWQVGDVTITQFVEIETCRPQTISRAQSMNRFTAGLRVRSLSVMIAAGHGRTG
jgi:hypothetical protein